MYLIPYKSEAGAYPPLQSNKVKGLLEMPGQFMSEFYKAGKRAAGFVDIEHDGEKVTSCVWNEENYQAWLATQPDPLDEIKKAKEAEISNACNSAIINGMDVETTKGIEHFDLTEVDQINLTTALGAVDAGAESHPYHSKKTLCRMFSADEIKAISQAAVSHSLYHQTLCNHLLTWVRRAETEDEINSITYSPDNLPQDLKENMASVLTESTNVLSV